MIKSVVIIGASRGIGLGFARAYADDDWEVHATTRSTGEPSELDQIQGDITIYSLEVRNSQQISALAEKFADRGIGVLIHNAGVYGDGMEYDDVMSINAEAPFNVISALLTAVLRDKTRKVVILTSGMGARDGGATPSGVYGQSKCALNDRFREIEPTWRERGITAVVFHPGWVATDMGGPSAPLSVGESVTGMRHVIQTLTPTDSGGFFTWKGARHPW